MQTYYSYLSSAAVTDQGLKRENNEDAYAVFPEHGVFCVADGMGGAEDGEIASKATLDAISDMLKQFNPESPLCIKAMQAWLCQALNEASAWMFNQTAEYGRKGMGTTIVGVCFNPESPGKAVAFHAGDSRAYLFHKGSLKQITLDHNLANEAGIDNEKELSPQYRNVILRAVGLEEKVNIEMTEFALQQGDYILLCSDGLTKMVEDRRIEGILVNALSAEDASRLLVEEALKNGGRDNVTVLAISVGLLPQPLAPELLTMRMPAILPARTNSSSTSNSSGTPTTDHSSATPHETPGASKESSSVTSLITCEQNKKFSKYIRDLSQKPLKATGLLFFGIIILRVSFLLYGDRSPQNVPGSKGPDTGSVSAVESKKQEADRLAAEAKAKKEEEERKAEAERKAKLEREKKAKEDARLAAEAKARQDEEIRKAEAERVAKLEREKKAKEDARLAAEAKARQDEELRKAESERVAKLEREKKAKEDARLAAEAKARQDEENRKAEVKRMVRLEKERKEKEAADRLAAENKAKGKDPIAEWESVKQLMALVENDRVASAYYKFMSAGNDSEETANNIEKYEEARNGLVEGDAPTKETLPEYTESINQYVKQLVGFVNAKAIQRHIETMNADNPGMDNETKIIWENLLKEAQEISKLKMEESGNRQRLVKFVYAIAKYTLAAPKKN